MNLKNIILILIILVSFTEIVSAIEPVTYTCCKNFTTNSGTTIQSFENAALWTLSASGTSSKGNDTVHFIDGTNSVYLDSGNVSLVQSRADVSFTFNNNQTIGFWAYSNNWTKVSSITILFYKGTKYGDQGSIGKGMLNNTFSNTAQSDSGWQYFTFNTAQATFTNMSITDPITYMRIKMTPVITNDTARVSFDKTIIGFVARPKFFFDFDDGRLNISTMAQPVMAANNQRGTMFITTTEISNGNQAINISEMNRIYSAGWDISSHLLNHVNLLTMSNSTIDEQLLGSYNFYYNSGFTRSARFIAYPIGGYDDNVINRTKNSGYIIGRTVNSGVWSANIQPTDPDTMHFRQTEFGSGVSTDTIIEEINNTIIRNGTMHFLVHGLQNFTDSYVLNYNLSDFKIISDYVASRSADIDSVTYNDMVIKTIPNNTAIKNNKSLIIYANGSTNIIQDNYENYETINMIIVPSSDNININVSKWEISGSYNRSWIENSSNSSITTLHTIGDLPINTKTYLNIDGLRVSTLVSNSTGYVTFNYVGGYSQHLFEISTYVSSNININRLATCASTKSYSDIVFPLMGLLLMITGFGTIFITLKSSFNEGTTVSGAIIISSTLLIVVGFGLILVGNYLLYAIYGVTC